MSLQAECDGLWAANKAVGQFPDLNMRPLTFGCVVVFRYEFFIKQSHNKTFISI